MPRMIDVKDGARTRVWLALRNLITADETLAAIFQTFIIWDGSKLPAQSDLTSMVPLLRLTPVIGPMAWYSPDAQYGPLIIHLLLGLQTRDICDYLNAWEAIEEALYPYDNRMRQLQIQQMLRDAGAETGQVEFTIPPADYDPRQNEDGTFFCTGSLRISVVRSFTP